jgi:prepilin-type N-terminal cleavage/methylation domain-containing protein
MKAQPRGFTLVELLMAVVILGALVLLGFPRMSAGVTGANVRGGRTTLINLLAKARTFATQSQRITLFKVDGSNAFVLARPRLLPGAGDADTIGPVERLGDNYGVTVTATVDSVRFDPRGLGTGFGTGTTFLVSRSAKTDTITIDGFGRVSK